MTTFSLFSIRKSNEFNTRNSISLGNGLHLGTVSRYKVDTGDDKNTILNDPSVGIYEGTEYPVYTRLRNKSASRYYHVDKAGNQIAAIEVEDDKLGYPLNVFHCESGDNVVVMGGKGSTLVSLYWCLDDGILIEDAFKSNKSIEYAIDLVKRMKLKSKVNETNRVLLTPNSSDLGKGQLNRAPLLSVRNSVVEFFQKVTDYPESGDEIYDEELQVGFMDYLLNCHAVSVADAKNLLETQRNWMSVDWFSINENMVIKGSEEHYLGWEELISKEKRTIFLAIRADQENVLWESPSFILVVDPYFDDMRPRLIPIVERGTALYLRTNRSTRWSFHEGVRKTEYVRLDEHVVGRLLIDQVHGFTTLGMPTKIKEVVKPMLKDIETQFKELLDIKVEPTELMFLHRKFEETP